MLRLPENRAKQDKAKRNYLRAGHRLSLTVPPDERNLNLNKTTGLSRFHGCDGYSKQRPARSNSAPNRVAAQRNCQSPRYALIK
jgi:hypothetical protein